MGQFEKLLIKILSGSKDKDINFDDLCKVLQTYGFQERVKGSHHVFLQSWNRGNNKYTAIRFKGKTVSSQAS